MRSWSGERGFWWAALACGLLLRAFFALHHPRFDGDTLVYGDLATNMWQHHVYGLTEGAKIRPTLIRLPGYPLYLAAFFSLFGVGSYAAAVWGQIALALGTCWALAASVRRLFGERAGCVALWLLCLCPFTAEYDALALTESLAMTCLMAALVGMERWWTTRRLSWIALTAAASSFAVLLRPDRGLLGAAVVLALLLLGRRDAVRPVALMCVLIALPLSVWTARNWRVFHVLQPLAPKYANDPGEATTPGFNRWYRSWAVEYWSTVNTYWMWDGGPLRMEDLPARATDTAQQRAETARLYARYNQLQSATPAVDAEFGRLADERNARHALRNRVWMPLGRVADMWLRPRTEFFKLPLAWWRWREHPAQSLVCLLYAALNLALLLAAAVGLKRWGGWWRHPMCLAGVLFVLLRSVLLLTIDNSEQRYTVDCLPVVLVLAALAFLQRENAALDESNGV